MRVIKRKKTILLFLPAASMFVLQRDLITAEKRAARCSWKSRSTVERGAVRRRESMA